MKLDPELKAKWVAALRSGEYQQGQMALRKREEDGKDKYCCLGVLCDLIDSEAWFGTGVRIGWGESRQIGYPPTGLLSDAFPDQGLSKWDDVKVTIEGKELPLDEHNDSNRTFAEIADAIEEQL